MKFELLGLIRILINNSPLVLGISRTYNILSIPNPQKIQNVFSFEHQLAYYPFRSLKSTYIIR